MRFQPAFLFLLAIATLMSGRRECHAHGIPIGVSTASGQLILTPGLGATDNEGFAARYYAQADADEDYIDLLQPVVVAGFGSVGLTNKPGYDITGMAPNSQLYLEVIPRPVKDASPAEDRLLWYWDPFASEDQSVRLTENLESMSVVTEFGVIEVPQADGPLPAPLKIANPNSNEIGQHIHPARYMLANNPQAEIGVFGFFAQLTSPNYAASEPFLVVFSNGVSEIDLVHEGALAINAAAVESTAGDINQDGFVDILDYVVWRITPGTEEEYEEWRENYELVLGGGASAANEYVVPEPGAIVLLIAATAVAASPARKRRGSMLRNRVVMNSANDHRGTENTEGTELLFGTLISANYHEFMNPS